MRETVVRGSDMVASWGMALIAALMATVVAVFFYGISWSGSIFLGVLAFVALGALFHALFLVPLPKPRGTVQTVMRQVATDALVVESAPPVAPDGKPALYEAPQGGVPDDLKQIRGIGPKMEVMLNSMGIWHFTQVASWRAEEVAWVDSNLEGFKGRVVRDDWVVQARILAAGGETAFSERVEEGDV